MQPLYSQQEQFFFLLTRVGNARTQSLQYLQRVLLLLHYGFATSLHKNTYKNYRYCEKHNTDFFIQPEKYRILNNLFRGRSTVWGGLHFADGIQSALMKHLHPTLHRTTSF